ncbi:nucleoside-triphosphatase [Wallemia mellicola]|uniref:Adenylate kinase isoenzyme 6 homolog n=2 Tax=Wallemia mellicola TaxID=1708541 RepID=A0A4T0NQY9_9BASI|nr:nucleoside-triphosphatase [Wallemia mellicola CBS 633.66]TIB70717.1 hypothetical protein E3Q24_02752 [Wallemia mellicola]EIM22073.1 nucleoside-triphosphatase [Wallemia mellicola CBS 633.66]TIB79269.1 hypothetical protein E3Q23_00320 [Wallemia mellicola]TIB81105.1 nucleoside-triphosphatase [Wallemia mellicola]TIB87422.1 nucleoside-triphosphatase [Wallemia mellicola]|eukprot:XP_006957877.1 nucleoside-triphosphatase [Wallemia mellicola CBS 633.66]
MSKRNLPNILITGTPGTGKTTLSQSILESLNRASDQQNQFKHISIGDLVKQKDLHNGYNNEWQCYDVDDDKILDELESTIESGGNILDWHCSEIFPENWLDLVIVLRCDHQVLYQRLEDRGYKSEKIQENNDAEIFGECLHEALEAFPNPGQVVELQSEEIENLESNLERFTLWLDNWKSNNS